MKDLTLGPDAVEWLGTQYLPILTTAETDGAMSITDSVSPPASGPPRHIHHDADEAFVVLTGDVEFWLEGESFLRGPGQTAFIPRGREHTFRIVGEKPSRHLIILTPGGFEGFFADMARGAFRIPEDMAQIEESAKRHQLSFTGPPLGAEEDAS
ncbi:Cupin domain-containing protein [Palleronia salina]|uniref:Cupin domain-containing protein n=2 Tax=Palleronia TaxID=315422 RepID=A0A1M6G825_9RHOB|nr:MULTISPECIES: cupin domain-containing protein [Palleronia]SEN48309.1 Cupin domain-containing protein [Palleronia pelagia]SHJ06090.1 Cupin domain-containing protein [Palleronia salina]